MANKIVELQDTQQLPEITILQPGNLFEAVDGSNYDAALSLSEKYNIKNDINSSESVLSLILADVCSIINQISSKHEIQAEVIESKNILPSTSFLDIVNFLMKFDLDNTFKSLENYMESINKKDYEFLIVDLIKLSLVKKDKSFTKPIATLTYISWNNFVFDISNYIQEFYITLSQNKLDESRIYLDIISKSNKLNQDFTSIETLRQALDKAEAETTCKKVEFVDNKDSDNIQRNIGQNSTKIVKTTESDKGFIKQKHELLLKSKGIILLQQMNKEKRKSIHSIVRGYSDMMSFSIGYGDNNQVVLRYKPQNDEYIDIKGLLNKGSAAYKNGDYDECIKNYLQLLNFGNPKAFIYAKLGLAYMKKRDKKTAIDYLTVATLLSKRKDGKIDFTELIGSLNGLTEDEDKKPYFRMKIKDFSNDIQKNYGIENLDEITSYILETGLDVETACHKLGITEEQTSTIQLIYAKKFYSQGNTDKGDQFFRAVEKSKSKTKPTSKLLEEIRKNKRFYINRGDKDTKQLTLTLQPKSKK